MQTPAPTKSKIPDSALPKSEVECREFPPAPESAIAPVQLPVIRPKLTGCVETQLITEVLQDVTWPPEQLEALLHTGPPPRLLFALL